MTGLFSDAVSPTIGRIYDRAVDPALWEPMMCDLRDQMDFAYLQIVSFRTLLISKMLDQGRLQLQLHRALLDTQTIGVFIVDENARIVLSNDAGDAMLGATGALGEVSSRLWPDSAQHRPALHDAILRASKDDGARLGLWGNGIALASADGTMSVAYVLPLGRSERRRAIVPGHAAVFVTDRSGARPPPAEVLTAMTGLTKAGARVAQAVAEGRAPTAIARDLDISVHALRKHLANIFEKTGLSTQSVLWAFINRFRLPVA